MIEYLNNNKLLDVLNLVLSLIKDFKTSGQLLEFSSKITALKHDLKLFFTILNFVLADMLLLKTQNMGLVKLKSISQKLLPILNDFSLNAIAKQIGILGENDLSITGEELNNLSDEELAENIDKYAVFARKTEEGFSDFYIDLCPELW